MRTYARYTTIHSSVSLVSVKISSTIEYLNSKSNVTKILDPEDPMKVLVDITAEQSAYLQKIADETVHVHN